jgi:hypothetical protein
MLEGFEILFSGATRLVTAPLSSAEEGLLQRSLAPGETMERYLRGRGERVGWMLWALTPQRLHCVTVSGRRPARAHVHGSVMGVEATRGRWGATILVRTSEARELIFAADFEQSDEFLAALVSYNSANVVAAPKLAPAAPPPPARRTPVVSAPRIASGAPSRGDADSGRLVEALREAADLREKGLLTEEEFAALKRKLLGP